MTPPDGVESLTAPVQLSALSLASAPPLFRRPLPRSASLLLFWFGVAACVIAQLAILRDVIAGGKRAAEATSTRQRAEIAWSLLPAIGLVVVFAATWRLLSLTGP
jgi:hypothetical protein